MYDNFIINLLNVCQKEFSFKCRLTADVDYSRFVFRLLFTADGVHRGDPRDSLEYLAIPHNDYMTNFLELGVQPSSEIARINLTEERLLKEVIFTHLIFFIILNVGL